VHKIFSDYLAHDYKVTKFHVVRQQTVTTTTQINNMQYTKTTFERWPRRGVLSPPWVFAADWRHCTETLSSWVAYRSGRRRVLLLSSVDIVMYRLLQDLYSVCWSSYIER